MSRQTLQITRRGPGRPKTRNTETTTLNLDREVLKYLKEMSIRYNMAMNHVIENLVLSAINQSYPLQLAEENLRLKRQLEALEKDIKRLESELEKVKSSCDSDDPRLREIRELKEKTHRVLERHGELKVFELVMKSFNVAPGERLHHLVKNFIDEYFVDTGKGALISKELELVITKNPRTGYMGWIVKKLQDS